MDALWGPVSPRTDENQKSEPPCSPIQTASSHLLEASAKSPRQHTTSAEATLKPQSKHWSLSSQSGGHRQRACMRAAHAEQAAAAAVAAAAGRQEARKILTAHVPPLPCATQGRTQAQAMRRHRISRRQLAGINWPCALEQRVCTAGSHGC